MTAARVPLAERLRSMIAVRGAADCWLWTGPVRRRYGAISAGGAHGRTLPAHRVAWELANGTPVPEGLQVRHKCDVPLCCNPAHLEVGTAAANSGDRVQRGRHVRGAAHPKAHLQDSDVRAIRGLLAGGARQRDVAAQFGVHQAVISGIHRGKRWSHVRPEAKGI